MDKQLASRRLILRLSTTKRDRFLAEMAAVVPWSKLQAVIEPCYPTTGGRLPFRLGAIRHLLERHDLTTAVFEAVATVIALVMADNRANRSAARPDREGAMFRRIAVAISIAVALAPAGAAELKVMGAGPVEGTVKELVPAFSILWAAG